MLNFSSKPGKYLHLSLADSSGEIEAKLWEWTGDFMEVAKPGKVIFVTGQVDSYMDTHQIRVDQIRVAVPEEIDRAHYFADGPRSIEDMQAELKIELENIKPGAWYELGQAFLSSEYYEDYCRAPAAQMFHQNYRGGLLEHSLGTAGICLKMAELYPEIDPDLILIGALFHDLGKSQEMHFVPGIEYTDEGKLLGHIVLGVQMLSRLVDRVSAIDDMKKNQLLHIITSHHGEYKWQSPKRPMFLEAKVVHLADMMDAEIWKFKSAVPAYEGSKWSDFMKTIGSQVYLGGND